MKTSPAGRTCVSSHGLPTSLLLRQPGGSRISSSGSHSQRLRPGGPHLLGRVRRRLDLAAALVHEPPVLFLDSRPRDWIRRGRRAVGCDRTLVAGGTTVLLTTQYLEEADRLADNIVVIDHGAVIAEGTSSSLKARMGATVIEIGFKEERDAAAGVDLLTPVGRSSAMPRPCRSSVPGGAGAHSMLAVVRIFDSASLDPATMVLREPTLDDVFLALTGHAAVEQGDGEQATGRSRRERRAAP